MRINDHVFEYVFFLFRSCKDSKHKSNQSALSSVTINAHNVYQEILKRFFCILNQVGATSEFSSCHLGITGMLRSRDQRGLETTFLVSVSISVSQ